MVQNQHDQKQNASEKPQLDFFSMVEHSPLAIVVHRKGMLYYANKASREMFAIGDNLQLCDYSILDFARPEDHAEIRQRIKHITHGGSGLGAYHLKMLRLDGRPFDAEIQVRTLNHAADPDLVQVCIQDISQRKEVERAMFDAERRYRAMAEKNPHFIFILQDGLIVFSNSSANQTLAHSQPDLFHPPQSFVDLIDVDTKNLWKNMLAQLQNGHVVEPFIVSLRDARRHKIPAQIDMIPLDNSQLQQGHFTQILVVATDLRCLTKSDSALPKDRQNETSHVQNSPTQSTQFQDELNAFVYAVSHDLRSPLHHISGFTDAALDEFGEQLGEDGRSYLQRVLTAVTTMTSLIDALLDLSRLSHKKISEQTIDLGGLSQAVFLDLKQDPEIQKWTNKHPINLHVEKNLYLVADANQIRLVMEKLLHNAIKFSAANNPINVYVGRVPEPNKEGRRQPTTTFFVRDEGVGFDPKQAERLFTPFQRLHAKSDFPGLGMGLATVRRIISRHQGKVWVESQEGQGTRVFFTIPDDPG